MEERSDQLEDYSGNGGTMMAVEFKNVHWHLIVGGRRNRLDSGWCLQVHVEREEDIVRSLRHCFLIILDGC